MARKQRYLPDDHSLVEVTCRVIQRRFLLRPSPKLNSIIIGTLARFQQRHRMKICGFVYLSNHYHLLLRPESVEQLASFMRDVQSKIAREVGRLYDWKEKVWGRRYSDGTSSHEPESEILRLRYLLEQGCKERLVASPKQWPGATSTRALLTGEPLEGIWIDRTEQYRARERRESASAERFTTPFRLELSPLPCWESLPEHQRQAKIRVLVREIEREMDGVAVLGKRAICSQHPHDRPASRPPRTPAPRFFAVEPQMRRALEWGYRLFRIAYRQASEAWREGKTAEFPAGCFQPGRFVVMRS